MWREGHVLGTGEAGNRPLLYVARGVDVQAVSLTGPMSLRFRGPRQCTGSWEGGRRVPCPTDAVVGDQSQCGPCSGLEHPECVFEPICQGDASKCHCVTSFAGVEHVVYCAFHGTLAKIGMTQARRVRARLREQGADLYFVVARGLDRGAARNLERSLGMLYGIPEFRTHRETLPQLSRPVPWDIVERRALELQDRMRARHDVEPELVRIEDHPVEQPLPAAPRRVALHGLHEGTWLGGKGNNLFYAEAARRGTLDVGQVRVSAIKRADVVGHLLERPGQG
jgi:hypothetical protein